MGNVRNDIARMRRGHAAAAERQRELMRDGGPDPEQAVTETLAAAPEAHDQGAKRR